MLKTRTVVSALLLMFILNWPLLITAHFAIAQCATQPAPTNVIESRVDSSENPGTYPSVGIDNFGRFVIAWQEIKSGATQASGDGSTMAGGDSAS